MTTNKQVATTVAKELVKSRHISYLDRLPDWTRVRDCADGQRKVKRKGIIYLPTQGADIVAGDLEYTAYKRRALFTNFTGRTIDALVGMAYNDDPTVDSDLWGDVAYIADDADGSGTSLNAQMKSTLTDVVTTGRGGLLVDFPNTNADGTDIVDPKANISYYTAESILNWKSGNVGGENGLTSVLLRESVKGVEFSLFGGFDMDQDLFHFRHIFIGDDGFVHGIVYDRDGAIVDVQYDMIANGQKLTTIPFYIINANNVASSKDLLDAPIPPLLKIADVNIAHYQTDAEMRMAMHYHAMPQPVISGASQQFIAKYEEDPLKIGTTEVLMLEQGATFDLVQVSFQATSFHDELNRLRDTAVELGARLVMGNNNGVESTETVRLRQAGDISIMASIIHAITDAYESAVVMASRFVGMDGSLEPTIELNTELLKTKPDPQLIGSLISSMDRGIIGLDTVRDYYRNTGIIRSAMTREMLDADVASTVAGLTLADTAGVIDVNRTTEPNTDPAGA